MASLGYNYNNLSQNYSSIFYLSLEINQSIYIVSYHFNDLPFMTFKEITPADVIYQIVI